MEEKKEVNFYFSLYIKRLKVTFDDESPKSHKLIESQSHFYYSFVIKIMFF